MAGKNRGLLASVSKSLLAPEALSSTAPTVLTTAYHYDDFARLERVDYPGAENFSVRYKFDTAGNVISAEDAADSTKVYWKLDGVDEGYRINREVFGNGAVTERHFQELTGRLDLITTKRDDAFVQRFTYGYETNGNQSRRSNLNSGLTETFGYDALNRVTSTTYSDRPVMEATAYDPVSNGISHKDPVGDYTYQPQGRDWIKTAGDTEYTPDLFGNVNTRSGASVPGEAQEFTYTTFNLPSHVSLQSGDIRDVDFAYDADGVRVVKKTSNGTTYYADDLYQRTVTGTVTAQRFQIYAAGRAVAVANQATSSSPIVVEYLHDDALGSVESITAEDGAIVGARRFDAFGDPRGPIASIAQEPYGYTGQEQDPELGLVNMRGRMYDPRLGQFMSPDPEIQQPFSQGLNRFAYVFNSPLNFTDPSGFSAEEWETGLGLGVPYAAGLIATVASTGGSAVAFGGGEAAAFAAPEAVGAGAGASLAQVADAAVPAAGIASSLGFNAYFSGLQAKQQFRDMKPDTRSATAGGSGPPGLTRGGFTNNASSPVQEVTLVVRRYAPATSFGFGFHGDTRNTPDLSPSASYRLEARVKVNLTTGRTALRLAQGATSGVSGLGKLMQWVHGGVDTGHPTGAIDHVRQWRPGKITVDFHFEGHNPLVRGSADIDTRVRATFEVTGSKLEVFGLAGGDDFPNAEFLMYDQSGAGHVLGNFQTPHGVDLGPFVGLPGNTRDAPFSRFFGTVELAP